MSIRRLSSSVFFVLLALALIWVVAGSRLSSQAVPQAPTVISGRNVNMVSGTTLPGGDPWLQRQNEPSIAVSSRNALHLLAGANDYRTVDMPTSEGELPGKQPTAAVGDAWLGVYMSYDGGESWTSTMLPGFPQAAGSNPLKGYRAAADPVVRSGPNGLFYYSGIAFNRDTNLGVVFVARFIDDNNKESGGTIRYIDTKIIAKGTATKFLDKPWISVDQPRFPLTNITISGQTFPRHNVYVAYSSFSGTTTLLGDIMFARSTDCGTSWAAPIKISSGSYAHQGATIAIKPVIGEVLVAWRRFGVSGRTPDTIYVAQSFSRGSKFQAPVKVADVAPFDQPTTDETQSLPNTAAGPAFRTNSYPTIAVDKSGHVYLAWSQRGLGPTGDARIVLSTSHLGSNWSIPQPVANVDENGLPFLGNQIMPAMTFAAGKLALVWVDQRRDVSATEYGFNQWIIDSLPYRHTMDVWAAEAETSTFPNLAWRSSQVSRYLHALLRDQFGEIVYENGQPVIFPVQFNCVNYPLFKGGHNPFNGDYIDIAASPTFRQDTWRNWIFNADDERDPVFHVAWADNRDVRPPLDGNWTVYTPPASDQASAYISPEHPSCNPNGSGNEPGMRNQNIYTSRLTWGVDAGAPVNDKPLNLADGVARAFVVYVKNNTELLRSFRLSIAAQPAGGQASFDQFGLLTSLDVNIAPFSTIARTVFIGSSDINATVTVNINETDSSGTIISDGLTSFIDINSDTSNPQMSGTQETHNPNIVNSANPNIVNWFVNPNIVNPNIVNPNIVNPNIVNPNIVNPNIVNPNIVNPNIVNPNIVNPNIVNPNIVNPNIVNPNIVNPNIVNPNIVNPNIVNANPDDVTATDVEWTVRNDGTATTSYSLKTLAKKAPPQGVYVQLLVYRVHYTPAVSGAELKAEGVEACTLKQEPHHELVLNVVNPNIVNPNIVNPNIVNPNIVNADIENATFSVAPGEEVVVDLRVLDSGEAGGTTIQTAPQMAIAAGAASAPAQALTVDEFIQSLGFAVTSHAVNSADVAMGSEIPPADATDLVIGTSSLPDGVEGYSYDAPLSAFGGLGSYVWSLNAGELPPGLSVASGGAIIGMPTQRGTYQFIIRVDSGGQFDTQQYVINIDSDTAPDTLTITTTSIPSGVQGVWYGATLQAVGGVWPRSWSLASGTLPGGVSLDSGGVISGTPTVTGSFGFTARVADRNGTTDTQAFTLVVASETTTYFDITGVVFDEGGAPLGGVVLRGLPNTPVTAADGTYADTVPAEWSGTAIPFAAGHSFTPPSRAYTSLASSQGSQNYNTGSATLSIFATVALYGSGPLSGVVMTGLPGNPTTDASGNCLVSVPYGWSGIVTPVLSGYTFAPPTLSFTNIPSDQTAQFTATPIVGPASKLIFTQSPSGGIGGAVWTTQPIVEIQDAAGNRVTSDSTSVVTVTIESNPGSGTLSGDTTIQAVNGAASFADLSIEKGGGGYTLRATTSWVLIPATSGPFGIEGFSARASMSVGRRFHTATFLNTDKILIAGGMDSLGYLKSAELYDPANNSFASLVEMLDFRGEHTATTLLDGRVLIAGGGNLASSAELFDPASGTFMPTGSMIYNRQAHAATRLQDGRLLVTGSFSEDGGTAEIYDPVTGTWTETDPLSEERSGHTSTWLPNGKVLIAGGRTWSTVAYLASAEIFDPAAGTFTSAGDMAGGGRADHTATLLDDGTVLIAGGHNLTIELNTAEIFDPVANTFTPVGPMNGPHSQHEAVLLRDGTVLIIGGGNPEIYDPETRAFRLTGPAAVASLNDIAAAPTAEGLVFISGGYGESIISGTEMWNPLVPFPTHVISGYVTYLGAGVPGVLISGFPGFPITDSGGYYEAVVMEDWSGTVIPTKAGGTFTPASETYTAPILEDIPGQNYTATALTYTLTYIAGANGSIVGTTPQTVNHGESGTTVTATSDANYHFASWSDGILTADRTDTNITADLNVTANFAIDTADLVVDSLILDPANPTTADDITFTAIVKNLGTGPAESSTLKFWVTGVGELYYPVTALEPGASSAPITRTVSSGALDVGSNSAIATADDNGTTGVITESDETNNTRQTDFSVTPGPVQYTLTATCSPEIGGTLQISPGSPNGKYDAGTDVFITAVAASGYRFEYWSGDLEEPPSNIAYVRMDADRNVTAHFMARPDLIVESLTHDPVNPGPTTEMMVTAVIKNIGAASAGDSVLWLELDGATPALTKNIPALAPGASSTVGQVFQYIPAGDHTITAIADAGTYVIESIETNNTTIDSFTVAAPETYTITASAGTGGSISPSGAVTVNYGVSQSFTIAPSAGYQVADVLVDGASVGAVTSYAFTNVIADHTIAASFSVIVISPEIWRSPISMTFAGQEGGANPAIQTLQIKNIGGGTLGYDITSNAAWLSVSPANGNSTEETDIVSHSVLANIQGRPAGTYNAVLTIAATGASNTPQAVSVTLTIAPLSTNEWTARHDFASVHGIDTPTDVAVDASGNVIVVGESQGATLDFLIIKYSNSGTKLWEQRYDSLFDDRAEAVAVDSAGDVYVTGNGGNAGLPPDNIDYVTVKYRGTDGGLIWQQRYNGTGDGADHAKALSVDPAGDYVYVTGTSAGTGGNTDYATIKYAGSDGSYRWNFPGPTYATRYDGGANDTAVSVAADSSGNVYVTGSSDQGYTKIVTLRYDANGTQAWVQSYFSYASAYATTVTLDNSGHLLVAGQSYADPAKGLDLVVLKYDRADGNMVSPFPVYFNDNGADNSAQVSSALVVDPGDHIYVVGSTEISYDTGNIRQSLAIKLNSAGDRLWARKYIGPSMNSTEALAVAVDGVGSVYAAGYDLVSETEGIPDFITIKYDAAGNELWTRRYDGPVHAGDQAVAMALDSAGHVFVIGPSEGLETSRDFCTIRYDPLGPPINSVAGSADVGYSGDGGLATLALLNQPTSVVFDASGNMLIADYVNNCIREVNQETGIITTIAGTGTAGYNGDSRLATEANLNRPCDIALEASDNIYIADVANHRIRKITKSTGMITTIAGTGTQGFNGDGILAINANLNNPSSIALDSEGNLVFTDKYNQRVRKVDFTTGMISTIAGNGTAGFLGDGTPASGGGVQLNSPIFVRFDASWNMYIADMLNDRIRRVDGLTGIITTVAGNGTRTYAGDLGLATAASLYGPHGIAFDHAGHMYIGDRFNGRVRKVDAVTGMIITIAGGQTVAFPGLGDGGPAPAACLDGLWGLAFDSKGNLYIANFQYCRIRKVGD